MGSSLHTASSVQATNDTNIETNDQDVKAAVLGHVDSYVALAHGDCYLTGNFGKLRRSLSFWLALFESRERFSADPGNREIEGFSVVALLAPDLATWARNETRATTKMRESRCTTALREGGQDYIARGVTRANPAIAKKFSHLGVVNMALGAARVLVPQARRYQNTDPLLSPAGTLLPAHADSMDDAGDAEITEQIVRPGHASAGFVRVDRTENVSETENLTRTATMQHNGQILHVTLKVGVVGELTIS
jgi:hypothetical protein